jgi:hypothetical protein
MFLLSHPRLARRHGPSRSGDGGVRSWRRETSLELGNRIEEIGDFEDTIASSDRALAQDTVPV